MLDEANLRRLAEMGIDVYVPRAVARAGNAAPAAAPAVADSSSAPAISRPDPEAPPRAQADVVVLADVPSARAQALLADALRALKFARIACVQAEANDEAALATASALVMFGERHARAVGALLPAQRQREIGWVVSAELAALAGDATAKRALWSELKRLLRELAARTAVAPR